MSFGWNKRIRNLHDIKVKVLGLKAQFQYGLHAELTLMRLNSFCKLGFIALILSPHLLFAAPQTPVNPYSNSSLYKRALEAVVSHQIEDGEYNSSLESLQQIQSGSFVLLTMDSKNPKYFALYFIKPSVSRSGRPMDLFSDYDAGIIGYSLLEDPSLGLYVYSENANIQDLRMFLPPEKIIALDENKRLDEDHFKLLSDHSVHPKMAERKMNHDVAKSQSRLSVYEDSRLKIQKEAISERWRLRASLLKYARPLEWILNEAKKLECKIDMNFKAEPK